MNSVVDISINGEKHKAMILSTFIIDGRNFCLYAIPRGDGSFAVNCGRENDGIVEDIKDEHEKRVVDGIVSTILNNKKKEDFLNMSSEEDKFTVLGEDGLEHEAALIGQYEVEGNDYVVYTIKESDDKNGLYIKKLINDDDIVSITDPEEREVVFKAIREFIDNEVGGV